MRCCQWIFMMDRVPHFWNQNREFYSVSVLPHCQQLKNAMRKFEMPHLQQLQQCNIFLAFMEKDFKKLEIHITLIRKHLGLETIVVKHLQLDVLRRVVNGIIQIVGVIKIVARDEPKYSTMTFIGRGLSIQRTILSPLVMSMYFMHNKQHNVIIYNRLIVMGHNL